MPKFYEIVQSLNAPNGSVIALKLNFLKGYVYEYDHWTKNPVTYNYWDEHRSRAAKALIWQFDIILKNWLKSELCKFIQAVPLLFKFM